jgi:hypothetical protein
MSDPAATTATTQRPIFGQPVPSLWTVEGTVFAHCDLWDRISEMSGEGDEEPDAEDIMEGLRDAGHAYMQSHAVRYEVGAMSREEAVSAAEREALAIHGCCKECSVDWTKLPEVT